MKELLELEEICPVLKRSKTIAVVGISRNPSKTSREIASFLIKKGFNVVGVNPFFGENDSAGIPVYKKLTEIPFDIDIVNLFRRPVDIPQIMDDVLAKKAENVVASGGN